MDLLAILFPPAPLGLLASGPPGPPGGFEMPFNLDLNSQLGEVERCLHRVCFYLRISADGVPTDDTCLLDELF